MYKPLFFFVLSGWHLFVSGLPRPGSSTNETVLGDGEGLASNGWVEMCYHTDTRMNG